MKKSIISLVLALALGCEITPITTPRVTPDIDPPDANDIIALCEYNLVHTGPTDRTYCVAYDKLGDCYQYRVLDNSVKEHECHIEYLYDWANCQWETYNYVCY